MSTFQWIPSFEKLSNQQILNTVIESADWIEHFSHIDKDQEHWDVWPHHELEEDALLLKDTSLYGGAAGISLFYLRLYEATKKKGFLEKAEHGINYCISQYQGKACFESKQPYLTGAFIGFFHGAAGGAYVSNLLYKINQKEKYRDFAQRVGQDCIAAAHEENGLLTWYGFYGILGEGALILFLLDLYESYGDSIYLDAAIKAGRYILSKEETSPWGGSRWYVLPTETFPTIGKAGGYFPGFEYGAAGCGYIFAEIYRHTKDATFLEASQRAATYILNIASYSEDKKSALVRYNDTYLTDLYYLGICQGPIGTSRLFYRLFQITKKEEYKTFVLQLSNGLLQSKAPLIHSAGYWRTNCYCCGAPGMLEHFIHMYQWTKDEKFMNAANKAAEVIIGDSNLQNHKRCWYTSWNRHEPERSDAYIGLYQGSAGCASSLLSYYYYLENEKNLPAYLEDPYKDLY